MWAMLIPLLSGIFGENGPLGQYFKNKAAVIQAEEEYKLALLKAQAEQVKAEVEGDTAQRANYLAATSVGFRQGTFYFVSSIIIYSIIFPSRAADMWHNFSLIPQWVQYIYVGMLSVTWGLPVAKENIGLMFSSIGRAVETRREFKLEKARINREASFAVLRAKMFPQGLTQPQVDIMNEAFDKGENS